jgi:hypothetical protein
LGEFLALFKGIGSVFIDFQMFLLVWIPLLLRHGKIIDDYFCGCLFWLGDGCGWAYNFRMG